MNETEKSSLKNETIDKCLSHLDMLNTDVKTKQIVYMYMAELYQRAFDEGMRQGKLVSEQEANNQ